MMSKKEVLEFLDRLGCDSERMDEIKKQYEDAEKLKELYIKRCPDCNNDITKDHSYCEKCGWDGLCHA